MDYIIKELAEDFHVKELLDPVLGEGDYCYFALRKSNWNTLNAIRIISQRLHISSKDIGYAGNKDKKALTEQVISLRNIAPGDALKLQIPEINLFYLGKGKERITLGSHRGNVFRIVVRNLSEKITLSAKSIKNYVDDQRFGNNGMNVEIGRAIIHRDFKKACEFLKLEVRENDCIGALRTVDRRLLRLYVSAYQSYLWNKAASGLTKGDSLAVVGYLTPEKEVRKYYVDALSNDGITQMDFLLREMPELSTEGSTRKLFAEAKNFKAVFGADELHEGKHKATLEFELGKGVYATEVVKQLFNI